MDIRRKLIGVNGLAIHVCVPSDKTNGLVLFFGGNDGEVESQADLTIESPFPVFWTPERQKMPTKEKNQQGTKTIWLYVLHVQDLYMY